MPFQKGQKTITTRYSHILFLIAYIYLKRFRPHLREEEHILNGWIIGGESQIGCALAGNR